MGTGENEGAPWCLVAARLSHVEEMNFSTPEDLVFVFLLTWMVEETASLGDGAWHLGVGADVADVNTLPYNPRVLSLVQTLSPERR